jgi:hypothetical protein
MNIKNIGMKAKHMGMDWMWVDDHFSVLSSGSKRVITDFGKKKSYKDFKHLDSLANITFDIPEDPEYKESILEKLVLDPFPGKIPKKHNKSFFPDLPKAKSRKKYFNSLYATPNTRNRISASLESKKSDEENRIQNLYFNLHKRTKSPELETENSRIIDEKYQRLQEILKTIDTSKFQRYLESKKIRVPHYIESLPKRHNADKKPKSTKF